MIVSTRPLIDCCPVVPAAMEGRQMVQWDKDSCADAGFLKIDLLGPGDALRRRALRGGGRPQQAGERIDLSRIPFDDQETYRAIRAADTVGVFQIESRAQMQSLLRTRPRNLDDLTIQVAIVRPGPIQGGAVNPYIERLQRLREDPSYEIPYDHPALEPVLRETLGTIIFQDQVMQVAEALRGLHARGGRRVAPGDEPQALAARCSGATANVSSRGRCSHSGATAACAEQVWQMVAGFAGFGFPKAHSAAFGLLAYQSTWLRRPLRARVPMRAAQRAADGLLRPRQPRPRGREPGHRDPAGWTSTPPRCAARCRTAPCGSASATSRTCAETEMRELVAERERGGPLPHASPSSPPARGAGAVTLEQLAWSGACDELIDAIHGRRRRDARPAGRRTHGAVAARARRARGATGRRAKGAAAGAAAASCRRRRALRWLGRWQRLIADYSTSGVTVGDHAMAVLRERLTAPMLVTSAQLDAVAQRLRGVDGRTGDRRQRPGTANGTMFLLFEDEFGTVNLIVPREVYERHRHLARAEPLLLARGRVERSEGVVNLLVRELVELERFIAGGVEGEEREAALARVHQLPAPGQASGAGEDEAAEVGSSMRAVAPPIQSFAMGRRR